MRNVHNRYFPLKGTVSESKGKLETMAMETAQSKNRTYQGCEDTTTKYKCVQNKKNPEACVYIFWMLEVISATV